MACEAEGSEVGATRAKEEPVNSKSCSLKVSYLLLMDKILHDLKDSKLWELWYSL